MSSSYKALSGKARADAARLHAARLKEAQAKSAATSQVSNSNVFSTAMLALPAFSAIPKIDKNPFAALLSSQPDTQPLSAPANAARSGVAHAVIKVMVRSSRGDGTRLFGVEAPASGTIADFKQLLCHPPHSMHRDGCALVLVLKGKCASAARTSQRVIPFIQSRLTVFNARYHPSRC